MKATEDMQNTLPAQSEYNKPETVARDLREYIAQLEAEGELVRCTWQDRTTSRLPPTRSMTADEGRVVSPCALDA